MDSNFAEKFKKAVTANFNQSKDHYLRLEEKYGFFLKLTDALLAEIQPSADWQDKTIDILDVGCGTGSSVARLQKAFPSAQVVGLDISGKMLEAARTAFPEVKFVQGDGEYLSQYFSAGSFDLVVYPASLFIMPNQEKSLQGAKQVLKPDGAVAASVLLGLKEQNQPALENLPAFKGIIKNDELPQLFAQYFHNVTSTELNIPLNRAMADTIYHIEALSAGAFPGKPYPERVQALNELLDEVDSKQAQLVQKWLLVAGYMKK